MRSLTIALALSMFVLVSSAQNEKGWIKLFDGTTLNGWHSYGKPAPTPAWKVEDGTIHFDVGSNLDPDARKIYRKENSGDLVTDKEFKNFDFKLEWKFGTISIVGDVGGMALCQDDGFTQRYKVAVVGEGTQMYDVDIPE